MKLKYGRGSSRLFDVNIKTDYFLDNGACIQIVSRETEKAQFVEWAYIHNWIFSKRVFQKLLKNGFVQKAVVQKNEKNNLEYYQFTPKVHDYPGEFR